MSKRRKKPSEIANDLERAAIKRAQARQDANSPDKWGVGLANLKTPAHDDVSARTVGKVIFAHRTSWIDRLLVKGEASHHAVTRLSEAIAVNRGEDGGDRGGVSGTGSRELVNDRMMEAGRLVAAVMFRVGAADRALLMELIVPVIVSSAPNAWRITVARQTGEKDERAQGAVVRAAARNLAEAWSELDRMPRQARREAAA